MERGPEHGLRRRPRPRLADLIGCRPSGIGARPVLRAAKRLAWGVVACGVTVNRLAIENEEPGLGAYYAEHVIGGSGAFVITIQDFGDFTAAIRQKLIREIASMVVAAEAGKDRRLRFELSDYVATRNCKECALLQRHPGLVSKWHAGQEKDVLVRRGHRYPAPFN